MTYEEKLVKKFIKQGLNVVKVDDHCYQVENQYYEFDDDGEISVIGI